VALKPGKWSRYTVSELAEIRAAHTARREALRLVKEIREKHGINSQRFSQLALGQVDGRKPRPDARSET
jgi:hypothetical protein